MALTKLLSPSMILTKLVSPLKILTKLVSPSMILTKLVSPSMILTKSFAKLPGAAVFLVCYNLGIWYLLERDPGRYILVGYDPE